MDDMLQCSLLGWEGLEAALVDRSAACAVMVVLRPHHEMPMVRHQGVAQQPHAEARPSKQDLLN
jgi:hypothetical protein